MAAPTPAAPAVIRAPARRTPTEIQAATGRAPRARCAACPAPALVRERGAWRAPALRPARPARPAARRRGAAATAALDSDAPAQLPPTPTGCRPRQDVLEPDIRLRLKLQPRRALRSACARKQPTNPVLRNKSGDDTRAQAQPLE
jgi:hypothetical protein